MRSSLINGWRKGRDDTSCISGRKAGKRAMHKYSGNLERAAVKPDAVCQTVSTIDGVQDVFKVLSTLGMAQIRTLNLSIS
jgi:hypothetical protein